MSQTPGDGARCPKCGALLRPDAQWCGLCYADLRPALAVPAAVAAAPAAAPLPTAGDTAPAAAPAPAAGRHARAGRHAAPGDPLTAPLGDIGDEVGAGSHAADTRPPDGSTTQVAVTWPCLACGASARLDDETCPACGAAFLGGALQAGDDKVSRLTTTRSKVAIMVGGSLGLMGVLLLLMYVIGTVF